MRVAFNKNILYSSKDKTFYAEGGNNAEEMQDAFLFDDKETAEQFRRSHLDFPDDFELWNVEIVYQTK